MLFAFAASYYYLTRIQPLISELSELESRETALLLQLKKKNDEEKALTKQRASDGQILESLKTFESYLKPEALGKTQIINEINSLRNNYGVSDGNTAYRTIVADATTDENGNLTAASTANASELNIYPAFGMETTVIGDYQSLRRFIADLERSKQFLIINSLSFQGEAERGRRPGLQPGIGQRQGQGQLVDPVAVPVSLKIELDTFFR
jgi:Type II secretion system (T2SS), protein M subtype b